MWFVIITLFDQLVKYIVEFTKCEVNIVKNIFNLSYAQNTGGIYGMFQGNNNVFIIISLILMSIIYIYVLKTKNENKTKFIVWQFVLAGGLSNVIDRIFRGYVVDFIQMKFFGIFNLADICIVIGVIIIIFLEFKEMLNESNRSNNN